MKPYHQTQARELYMQGGLNQQQIADLLNVNRKTVGLWIQQGQWQQLRIAAQQCPAMLLQDFYNQLAILNETIHRRGGIPTIEESVVQRRLIMNIQSFKQQPVSNYMQTYTELINEIRKQNPELAKQVTLLADGLIRQKAGNKRLYTSQDMFLTDELEEEHDQKLDSTISNHNQSNCSIEPELSIGEDHIEAGPCDKNATFCDIPQNTNTVDNSDVPHVEPPKDDEKNNSENATKEPNRNYVPVLSNGIIWLGKGYVYDPVIGKKREITFSELNQFKDLNPPPPDLNSF